MHDQARDQCMSSQVIGSSDANKRLTGKVPDAGKDVGQEKKMSEDEMAGYINNAMNRNLGQLWEM